MAVEPQQQAASAPNAAPAASTAPAGGGGGAPQRVVDSMSTRVDVINTHAGRILCVADVRGQSPSLSAPARPRSLILSRVDRVTRPTACRRRSDSTSATQRTAMHAYRGGGPIVNLNWAPRLPNLESEVRPLPTLLRRAKGVVRLFSPPSKQGIPLQG